MWKEHKSITDHLRSPQSGVRLSDPVVIRPMLKLFVSPDLQLRIIFQIILRILSFPFLHSSVLAISNQFRAG